MNTTLKDLAVDHPYYCSSANYYSNDKTYRYKDWQSFFAEMGNADLDMNLLFRWDIAEHGTEDEEGNVVSDGYYDMHLFYIQQRKGIFMCSIVERLNEEDVPQIIAFLGKYWQHMQKLWVPIPGLRTYLPELIDNL